MPMVALSMRRVQGNEPRYRGGLCAGCVIVAVCTTWRGDPPHDRAAAPHGRHADVGVRCRQAREPRLVALLRALPRPGGQRRRRPSTRRRVVDRIVVGDARDMRDVADNSVALVVTSPPYFAGKAYEEALGEGAHPRPRTSSTCGCSRDVFAECVRVLQPGGRIAVNVANLGRRPYRSLAADVTTHPAGRPAAAAARRGRVGEAARRRRQLRVGLLPATRQPGAARPHRAGGHREQGPLRPGHRREDAGPRRACLSRARSAATSSWRPPLDVWEMPPESAAAGRPPGPVPGGAARAADPPVHLRGRPRARPVHGFGHHRRGRGPHRPPLRRLRHRPRLRRRGDRSGSRPSVIAPQVRVRGTGITRHRSVGRAVGRRRTWPRRCWSDAGFTAIADDVKVVTGVHAHAEAIDCAGWPLVVRGRRRAHVEPARVRSASSCSGVRSRRVRCVHEAEPAARFGVLTRGSAPGGVPADERWMPSPGRRSRWPRWSTCWPTMQWSGCACSAADADVLQPELADV